MPSPPAMSRPSPERTARASASRLIDAPADTIWAILTDYAGKHLKILPAQYFKRLDIEQGGQGAGTRFRATLRVMGTEVRNHMLVSEPDPGRVLAETDLDSGLLTTFTLEPAPEGTRTHVVITTTWTPKTGIAGWIERAATQLVMARIYRPELDSLARFAAGEG